MASSTDKVPDNAPDKTSSFEEEIFSFNGETPSSEEEIFSFNGETLSSDGKTFSSDELSFAQTTAVWVGSFLDELIRWGVRDVVISPGSRSCALAMTAYELAQLRPEDLQIYMDVDERGAAFFGLGLAKASGRPVALICTSGTAVANYYPAVIEAETSRVPLVILSADRPPRLQGLGAPQTCDQLKIYGDHVRAFRSMPLPSARMCDIAFARQAAREACLAALGGHATFMHEQSLTENAGQANAPHTQIASRTGAYFAGPVQVNFPFDEPLKPDFFGVETFTQGRSLLAEEENLASASASVASTVSTAADKSNASATYSAAATLGNVHSILDNETALYLANLLSTHCTLVLAGEGTCTSLEEAHAVISWAQKYNLPLLADPLSGLRTIDNPLVIDNYDSVFTHDDCSLPNMIIRFGRYPVSKRATTRLAQAYAEHRLISVVVDVAETRDFNSATDMFIPMTPLDFIQSSMDLSPENSSGSNNDNADNAAQHAFAQTWIKQNDAARYRILAVETDQNTDSSATNTDQSTEKITDQSNEVGTDQFEGAYLRKLLELAPAKSCIFAANSMTVRMLDTFLVKDGKPLCILGNRGQNGIDGTTSTALGAAQKFAQTTYITGDLGLLHDLNALALQREILKYHPCSIVIVLFNNNGGAIFDTLPQSSNEPYFERLFLTPQDVDFEQAASAFHIPYYNVDTPESFEATYTAQLGVRGISLIEIRTPLRKQ